MKEDDVCGHGKIECCYVFLGWESTQKFYIEYSKAESVIVMQKGSLSCQREEMLHTVHIISLLKTSIYLMYHQDEQ